MTIRRDDYLQKLIDREGNGLVKVITGVRRCGKSFLLFRIFREWLVNKGVSPTRIVEIALDDRRNANLRDPDALLREIDERTKGHGRRYVFLDEVQYVPEFEDVLNSLLHSKNVDVYVTGSNSKFLSSDVITEFRGRGDEIRVHPLTFSEFLSRYKGTEESAWQDYCMYGGLPYLMALKKDEDKADYLVRLVNEVYLSDISERHRVRNVQELDELLDILSSGVGSYTNPLKLANTFKTLKGKAISDKTVASYLSYFADAFLVSKASRWDIKGRKYVNSPSKWYFEDIGLRNARINFRQQEENHIMENVIYNELRARGCAVDVGVVEVNERNAKGENVKKLLEVDFVVGRGSSKWYVQSAFEMPDDVKRQQEIRPFKRIPDSFEKIVVVKDAVKPWRDENGVLTVGIREFLLRRDILS